MGQRAGMGPGPDAVGGESPTNGVGKGSDTIMTMGQQLEHLMCTGFIYGTRA